MLPVWWLSIWEISEIQINWRLLVLLQDCPSPQLLSAFPNSTTGVSCFCQLVGCKYLPLILSVACWVLRSVAMLGPFLWVLHSLSNSVRPWDLPLSWIPFLGLSLDLLFLRLLSISIPVILSDRNNYGSELWLWDGNPIPHLMPCLPARGGLYKFPLPTVWPFI